MPSPVQVEAHGRKYRINDPGGLMGHAIVNGGAYERKVLEHIYRTHKPGIAIDAGASIGNHTLWLAGICRLKVIAFEPLDYPRLQENVALNPELDITVHPVGLADIDGRVKVTGPPQHVAGVNLPDGQVPVVRLDGLNFDNVTVIKIDVEGMEPSVLMGAADTISRCRPAIYAEAQDEDAHKRNAALLESWGYKHGKTFGATPLEEWLP